MSVKVDIIASRVICVLMNDEYDGEYGYESNQGYMDERRHGYDGYDSGNNYHK